MGINVSILCYVENVDYTPNREELKNVLRTLEKYKIISDHYPTGDEVAKIKELIHHKNLEPRFTQITSPSPILFRCPKCSKEVTKHYSHFEMTTSQKSVSCDPPCFSPMELINPSYSEMRKKSEELDNELSHFLGSLRLNKSSMDLWLNVESINFNSDHLELDIKLKGNLGRPDNNITKGFYKYLMEEKRINVDMGQSIGEDISLHIEPEELTNPMDGEGYHTKFIIFCFFLGRPFDPFITVELCNYLTRALSKMLKELGQIVHNKVVFTEWAS